MVKKAIMLWSFIIATLLNVAFAMSTAARAGTLIVHSNMYWICGCFNVDPKFDLTSIISTLRSSTSNIVVILHFIIGILFMVLSWRPPQHGMSFNTTQPCINVMLKFRGCFVLYNSSPFYKMSFCICCRLAQSLHTTKSPNKLVDIMFNNPPFCF